MSGSKVFEIESKMRVNDDRWHALYWEVSIDGMMLNVDNDTNTMNARIVLPEVYTWVLGEVYALSSLIQPLISESLGIIWI